MQGGSRCRLSAEAILKHVGHIVMTVRRQAFWSKGRGNQNCMLKVNIIGVFLEGTLKTNHVHAPSLDFVLSDTAE